MKAVVYTTYGPPEVLRIQEVAMPIPADDEVLIKVYAATVNRTDSGFRSAKYFVSRLFTGLTKPKRIVMDSYCSTECIHWTKTSTLQNMLDLAK